MTPKDLPISTHEYLLGVDVVIHARRMYCEMHDIPTSSGLSPDPEVHAVGTGNIDLRPGTPGRKYIAAWARRNHDAL